jgi:lipoprotein-releasing system permease protein
MKIPLPFEWIVAIRFLKEGSSQTLLTVVGAAVGVSVIVFMSAMLSGVQANIFNQVLSEQAHVNVSPVEEAARPLMPVDGPLELPSLQMPAQRINTIDQWQEIVRNLRSRPDVIAISPTVSGSGSAVLGETTKGVSIIGIEPDAYYKISDIPSKMLSGAADLPPSTTLIGKELASDFGVSTGDKLRLRSGDVEVVYTVNGVFDLGNRQANGRSILVSLRSAQSLMSVPGGVTGIGIKLVDPYQAEIVAAELRTTLGLNTESWIKALEQLFTALSTQSISFFAIEFFVALAVALGIASVLVVSVVQRSSEIGILRAMGASRGQVMRVFLVQGAIVGLAGSVAGSALAYVFVMLWQVLARNPDGTVFFPITLPLSLILITGGVATITGLFTAVLPAVSAARLNPVDAIRG